MYRIGSTFYKWEDIWEFQDERTEVNHTGKRDELR